jgi:hypothetical protein
MEKAKIQEKEKLLKDNIYNKYITEINELIKKLNAERFEHNFKCLKEEDQKKCIIDNNRIFFKKIHRYENFLLEIQKEFNKCTGFCKMNFDIPISECYLDCLDNFKDI